MTNEELRGRLHDLWVAGDAAIKSDYRDVDVSELWARYQWVADLSEYHMGLVRGEGDGQSTHIDALRSVEGSLRSLSVDVWEMTVDDPETATVESEQAGRLRAALEGGTEMDELKFIQCALSGLACWVEARVNDRLRLEEDVGLDCIRVTNNEGEET